MKIIYICENCSFSIVLSDTFTSDLSIITCPLCNSKLTYIEKK